VFADEIVRVDGTRAAALIASPNSYVKRFTLKPFRQ